LSGAQGIGIDNLVFSSGPPSLEITPGQPNLSYTNNSQISGSGKVTLSWPAMFSSSTLQSTANLGPNAVWQAVTNKPTAWQGMNYVTLPISGTQQFFSLEN